MNNDPYNTADNREDTSIIEFEQRDSRSEYDANRELAKVLQKEFDQSASCATVWPEGSVEREFYVGRQCAVGNIVDKLGIKYPDFKYGKYSG